MPSIVEAVEAYATSGEVIGTIRKARGLSYDPFNVIECPYVQLALNKTSERRTSCKAGNGIKVIVTMIGLDGHTTGGEVVSMILRDAGFEVVYLGVNQTPQMIIDAAIQEDVDVIGISSHASNYSQIEELMDLARQRPRRHADRVCGGNIPREPAAQLLAKGVHKIFLPGTSGAAIVEYLSTEARSARV
jgi:methylmalonyl-CoA mutase C-terminal domain/subunit